jgi:glycosyltransferase involved in cell wall biosynthesis
MYKESKIAAVIPVYNEEKFIGDVIRSIPDYIDRIVVVDDASTDRTLQVVKELTESNDRIVVLPSEKNQGVGGAMLQGYRHVLSNEDVNIAVKIDGDGQMPLEKLPDLLNPLVEGECEYSKGNRFLDGKLARSMPTHRLIGNFILTIATKLASGYWNVFDSQNGFAALRVECLKKIDLRKISTGYFFENDMLVHLNVFGYRIKDIPIPAIYGQEKSHISLSRVGLTFPLLLMNRFFYRIYHRYVLRDFSPIALFLFLGLLLFSSGIIYGSYLWMKSFIVDIPSPTGSIVLAMLSIILGFQLTLQGIVLDIQETPR